MLIGNMHPKDYYLLPDIFIYRNLATQSLKLMEQVTFLLLFCLFCLLYMKFTNS